MWQANTIDEVAVSARRYLEGQMSGRDLVRIVDDFVAANRAHDLDTSSRSAIDSFQDQIALYVPDEQSRSEAPTMYFCDDELKRLAEHFLRELGKEVGGKGG